MVDLADKARFCLTCRSALCQKYAYDWKFHPFILFAFSFHSVFQCVFQGYIRRVPPPPLFWFIIIDEHFPFSCFRYS